MRRTWMIDSLDREASKLGVTRQSLIKLWLAERLEETAYLLRTPTNARRLLASIDQLNAGQGVERQLIS